MMQLPKWTKNPTIVAATSGVFSLLVGVAGTWGVMYSSTTASREKKREVVASSQAKNREMNIKMVEISLAILREDPEKSKIKAAREWAVDLIDHHSEVPIPPDARKALIEAPRLDLVTSPDGTGPGNKPTGPTNEPARRSGVGGGAMPSGDPGGQAGSTRPAPGRGR